MDPNNILPEHPNPQLQRKHWQNLNGTWNFAIENNPQKAHEFKTLARTHAEGTISATGAPHIAPPEKITRQITVPFAPECLLSGVHETIRPHNVLWYRREFDAGDFDGGHRLILHFEAVDYACCCYVNGTIVGAHIGGYIPFQFDITDEIHRGANEIMLCAWDPTNKGRQLRGKQSIEPVGMWYTAQSGIWQTVWIEETPDAHIETVQIKPDAQRSSLRIDARVSQPGQTLRVRIIDRDGVVVGDASVVACDGNRDETLTIPVRNVQLWDTDDPYLYKLELSYGQDEVESYCAFRTVAISTDEAGLARFTLNGKPLLMRGVLDQGYWSDGLMTAPADDALVFDIAAMKDAGFNMLRKHAKVESRRWYYHCDRLGMLVWQDMVTGGGPWDAFWVNIVPSLAKRTWYSLDDTTDQAKRRCLATDEVYQRQWMTCMEQTMRLLGDHPCIVSWTLFNEGWGQFDSANVLDVARSIDDSRPIDATSGWFDQGLGDYQSVHNYFRTLRVYRDRMGRRTNTLRAFALTEFGGEAWRIDGHSSISRLYGYGESKTIGEWRKAVAKTIARAESLGPKGLSGYVYTQLSDVEEEVNGLLTFDRRVNKLGGITPEDPGWKENL